MKMRKFLSVLLAAAMIALLIPAGAMAAGSFEPNVPAPGVNWLYGTAKLVRDGNALKDSSDNTVLTISTQTDEDGKIIVTVYGDTASITTKTLYMPVTMTDDSGSILINSMVNGKSDFGNAQAYALGITVRRGGNSALYLLGDGMGHNQYVELRFVDENRRPDYIGNVQSPSYVGDPQWPVYPYYPYYPNHYLPGSTTTSDGTIIVGVPGGQLYPILGGGSLRVMSVEAYGDQFGNATASMVGSTLRVDVAAYTKEDRKAIGAAADDFIRVRVQPVNAYGYRYAAGTAISAASPTASSMFKGSATNAAGNYVLDTDGCFCLNIPGIKSVAGFTGKTISDTISRVGVYVGTQANLISVPVSYVVTNRAVTLAGAPATVSVPVGSRTNIVCTSSNGGAILPLTTWSVVKDLSDGQVSINGYSVTGLKAGTVVLVGTSGKQSVMVTVKVTGGSTLTPVTPAATTAPADASNTRYGHKVPVPQR